MSSILQQTEEVVFENESESEEEEEDLEVLESEYDLTQHLSSRSLLV